MANLTGDNTNNNITGTESDDQISGLGGQDNLIGLGGNDTLDGGAGDDTLIGGAGNDSLLGGDGDDYIVAGGLNDGGNDFIDGGNGGGDVLAYDYSNATSAVVFNATSATGTQVDPLGGTDTFVGIEEFDVYGGSAGDTLTGDSARNILFGNGGNDTLTGGAGHDSFGWTPTVANNGVDRVTDLSTGEELGFEGMSLDPVVRSGDDPSGLGIGQVMVGTTTGGITRVYVGTDSVAGADITIELVGSYQANGFVVSNEDWGTTLKYTLGTGYDDTITGTAGNDTLNGLAGNDTIDGGSGSDSIMGGVGNDSIMGGVGGDTLIGGAGNDTLDGGTITDLANYTDLNWVRFDGATTGVVVNLATGTASDGQGGTDTLVNINWVTGTQFNDSITGTGTGTNSNVFEQFEGGAGDDTLDGGNPAGAGGARASYLVAGVTSGVNVDLAAGTATDGLGGHDTLINITQVRGTNLNDTLSGSNTTAYVEGFDARGGNDTVDGRGGLDQYRTDGATGNATINLMTGTASDGQGGTDTLLNIEWARGGNFNDTLIGADDANNLQGMAGNDSLVGNGGNDSLFGGDGQDTLVGGAGDDLLDGGNNFNGDLDFAIFSTTAAMNVNLTTGVATGDGNDTLVNIEAVVSGGGNDSLVGNDQQNFLRGNGGDDTMDGGAGFDWVDYRLTAGAVNVNLATGHATGGAGNDTFTNMEAIRGGSGDDVLTGDGANNFFRGLEGNDTIDGGAGFDTADYREATAGVSVSLDSMSSSGAAGSDVLINIEALRGSENNDTLTGGSNSDSIDGYLGNDSISGGAGNDTLIGNDGNDTIDGGADSDNLFGGNGADSISGGSGNDFLSGDIGNDTLDGGDGYDTVTYNLQSFAPGTGANFFATGLNSPQLDGMGGTDTLLNVEQVNVFGTAFNDVIAGDNGSNYIVGNGGDDTLTGNGGNDTFTYNVGQDNGIDRINDLGAGDALHFQSGNGGAATFFLSGQVLTGVNPDSANYGDVVIDPMVNGVTRIHVITDANSPDIVVDLQGSFSAPDFAINNNQFGADLVYSPRVVFNGGPGDDSVQGGNGNDSLTGNGGNDSLFGNAGNDVLDGGDGNDQLLGGPGNDTVLGGNGDDYVNVGDPLGGGGGSDSVDGGAGYDTVDYWYGNETTAINFVATAASGTQMDPAGGSDTLANIEQLSFTGGSAGDTIVGDSMQNWFQGMGGNDTITGGGGSDQFVYDANVANGIDLITDFTPQDALTLSNIQVQSAIISGDDPSSLSPGQLMVGSTTDGVTRIYIGNAAAGGNMAIDLQGSFTADNFHVFNAPWGSSVTYGTPASTVPSGGNDSLAGTSGNDFIDGLAGDDTIDGLGGNDTLSGSDGNDLLAGSAGDDVLNGGTGNDTMDGGAGYDVVQYGYWGSSTPVNFVSSYNGQANATQADGAGGTDTLSNIEELQVFGGSAADTIVGGTERNFIEGGAGNDTLTGGAGANDTFAFDMPSLPLGEDRITDLQGGENLHFRGMPITSVGSGDGTGLLTGQIAFGAYDAGTNTTKVYVGADGTAGADLAVDLAGNYKAGDFQVFNGNGNGNLNYVPGVNLVGTPGNDTMAGTDSNDTLSGLDGDDNFWGGAGNDSILGGNGNDFLQGGAGADTLDGGAGISDMAGYSDSSTGVVVNLQTGATGGAAAGDVLLGIENLSGSFFNDTLTGSAGNNYIDGDLGDDVIDGGAGTGDMAGYINASGAVQVNLATGHATGANGNDTLLNIENVGGSNFDDVLTGDANNNSLQGNGGNDTLIGNDGADFLDGGAGNDSMSGGAGRDTFVNGAGDDTIDGGAIAERIGYADLNSITYASATSAINLNLQTGVVQDGLGGTDHLTNINFVTGSNFNDTLTGSDAFNLFEQFEGGAGNDLIDGGAIDALGTNGNRVTYQNAGGAVTVNLALGTATGAGNDTLVNINNVTGSSSGDHLIGSNSSVSEQFEGRGGNDTIDGAGGIDIVRYDGSTGAVNANLATGIVSADGWGGTDTLSNIEGLRGSNFNDVLTGGNAANDALEIFIGNGGNDAIDGGSGFDRVQYDSSTAGVNVTLGGTGAGTASDGLGGTDTLTNIEGVRGSMLNDVLTGSDTGAFETFEGRAGNDVIDGRGGIDRVEYTNDWAAVNVNLATGTAQDGFGGTDTLSNIEDVRGSSFNDTITGNAGANRLEGGAGNDTIDGGAGIDTAVYSGNRADYTITRSGGGFTVSGANATDSLTHIERLGFQNGTVSLGSVAADFDGDGKSDLLWRNGHTGVDAIWSSANGDTAQNMDDVGDPHFKIAGIGDFDGDGRSDVLWRNASTGTNVIWRNGDSAATVAVESVTDSAWKVGGTGDFNGDGAADILWHNQATGQNVIWNNGNVATPAAVDPVTDTRWYTAGVGDFDGDGRSDILWHNDATGDNAIWRGAVSTDVQTVAGISDPAWKLAGIADFDGDGKSDILWRNALTGGNAIWKGGDANAQQAIDPIADTHWTVGSVGDYDGDGRSDILWHNTVTGADAVWRGGDGSQGLSVYGVAGDNWQLPAQTGVADRHVADFDFDGDGTSDLVWRNPATGDNVAWGGADAGNGHPVDAVGDPSWKLEALADFNGDGKADVLWRNADSGANAIWSDGSSAATQFVDPVGDLNFKVAGVGDFNGDHTADILWRNVSTGENVIWKGADSTHAGAVENVGDQNWKIAGIGDFNGDGSDDVLWRNAVTGDNAIWRGADASQTQYVSSVGDTDWKVAGTGDFNGDGTDDLLWRNANSGENVIWRGADSTQAQAVSAADATWQVAGTGDYNGDGASDILWRNGSTGVNTIWQGGNSADGQAVVQVADPAWSVPQQDHTWLHADGTYGA